MIVPEFYINKNFMKINLKSLKIILKKILLYYKKNHII